MPTGSHLTDRILTVAMRRKKFSTRGNVGSDDVVILELNDREFKCKSRIPGIVLMRWVSHIDQDDPAKSAGAVEELMRQSIAPDDVDDFFEYIEDPVNDVDIKTLSQMAGWVVEQLTGNPTQESSDSSSGSRWSGPGSKDEPSVKAVT